MFLLISVVSSVFVLWCLFSVTMIFSGIVITIMIIIINMFTIIILNKTLTYCLYGHCHQPLHRYCIITRVIIVIVANFFISHCCCDLFPLCRALFSPCSYGSYLFDCCHSCRYYCCFQFLVHISNFIASLFDIRCVLALSSLSYRWRIGLGSRLGFQ